ncbi:MAG: tetratricopeptide repeat protein, partial [Pseudomonadota bacterium]
RSGTRLELYPSTRTLVLSSGEVDVDVPPGGSGRFRVGTAGFVVEVVGTRFVVNEQGVRTARGTVRVLDLSGVELAVLHEGDSFTAPGGAPAFASASIPAPVPVVAVSRPAPAPAPAQPWPQPVVSGGSVAVQAPKTVGEGGFSSRMAAERATVRSLLARAKQSLADGNAEAASLLVGQALGMGPSRREAAALHLLRAVSELVDKRPDQAIVTYRRVAENYARTSEGEAAAFALGQLLFEQGRLGEATLALDTYLARYPTGRFVREARDRLAQLRPSEE